MHRAFSVEHETICASNPQMQAPHVQAATKQQRSADLAPAKENGMDHSGFFLFSNRDFP
jgi:hypothetical protein